MPADKPTELSRIKLKTLTRQPVPMISKHSAHLTSLPFGIRTWFWRYTYLLLLISMLWHRQAIFVQFLARCTIFDMHALYQMQQIQLFVHIFSYSHKNAHVPWLTMHTVCAIEDAQECLLLCRDVVIPSVLMDLCNVVTHILQGCFTGTIETISLT